MSLVEIKHFNALIDNKPFFDLPIKSKQEVYEKLVKISRNDDYKARNLLNLSKITSTIEIIINLLAYIYQDKQIWVFLNKLTL